MSPKQTLAKEQTEVATDVSNEGIKVIDPVLKKFDVFESTPTHHIIVVMMYCGSNFHRQSWLLVTCSFASFFPLEKMNFIPAEGLVRVL